MKEMHPGGLPMTKRLLSMSSLDPCQILDMGSGRGVTVDYLNSLGFDAYGIDEKPVPRPIPCYLSGNFIHTHFLEESFDAILSECAFYVSGNPKAALREARRLLRPHGTLLLADVTPRTQDGHQTVLNQAGFSVLDCQDITSDWKEYYLSCIWDGTVDAFSCKNSFKGKFYYYLTICERM